MSLQFSEIDFNEDIKKKGKGKNKTLKNAKKPHENIKATYDSKNLGQHFLNDDEDSDSESGLADFQAYNNKEQKVNDTSLISPPQLTRFPDKKDKEPSTIIPNSSSYSSNASNTNSSYYEHFVPNYKKIADAQNIDESPNALMTKLNHILHLLEEQKDNKTSNVTEELILYLFLGVFVIFTVDSFTKVGKYIR
tara:strand:+ start:231 stop:809 length:579 start_codon:yes stop_codon:yes gene_type:complete